MNMWSQIARLGAAVAAFGPPVLTQADNEPEQVDMPTVGDGERPTASVILEAAAIPNDDWDVDANELPDATLFVDPYTALLPQQMLLQPPPATSLTGKNGPTPSTKSIYGDRRHSRGWHGGGQRYPSG